MKRPTPATGSPIDISPSTSSATRSRPPVAQLVGGVTGPPGSTLSLPAAAMVLVVYVLLIWAGRWLPWKGAASEAVTFGALAVALLVVARRYSDRPILRSTNLTTWRARSFALAVIPIAAMGVSDLAERVIRHLFSIGPTGTYNDIAPTASTSDRWLMWVVAVAGAVIFEEVLYRGSVLTAVLDTTGSMKLALVLPSVIWGLTHGGMTGGYNAAQVSGIIASGLVAGWGCYVCRSLAPGIAAHLLNNLLAGWNDVRPWSAIAAMLGVVAVTVLFVTWATSTMQSRRKPTVAADAATGLYADAGSP